VANRIVMTAPRRGEADSVRLTSMRSLIRKIGLGATAAWIVVMPVAGQSPASPAQRVTSDTYEYCERLRDRLSELVRVADGPPPQEVTSLASEGQRMCDQGQTRGGILRLRRALLIMKNQID